MEKLIKIIIVIILISNISFNFSCSRAKPTFVSVKDGKFILNERPYHFVGTNLWYAMNLAADTIGGDRERLCRELDALKAMGINNLRILGASEYGKLPKTLSPAVQASPRKYSEKLLKGLDFTLNEMRKRGMKAVIFLNNYWEWSGGMARYVSWATGTPMVFPHDPEYTWPQFMRYSARFYSEQQAIDLFYNYIKKIINRTNSINGIPYKADSTIMAWQLANEPRPGYDHSDVENVSYFLTWIKATSELIKSLDPNHLVSIGSEGIIGALNSEDVYRQAHQMKSVDYLTFHLWPYNWSWFDPKHPDSSFTTALKKSLEYIDTHIRLAEEIGKPIVLEEFGFPRDGFSFNPESTTYLRDKFYKQVFMQLLKHIKDGKWVGGVNFWAWGGEGRAADNKTYEWHPGDPFTGDPPHEPQGFYSVFNTDSSTIRIIKRVAQKVAFF